MKTTKRGNPNFFILRSKLRSQMTLPERLVWSRLKAKQFYFLKFRRQHGIGDYIVDFYCPVKRVAIEIDGDTHGEKDQMQLDKNRELYLRTLGVRVIRYYNSDVMSNLEGVLKDLWRKLMSTSPLPSLQRRGDL